MDTPTGDYVERWMNGDGPRPSDLAIVKKLHDHIWQYISFRRVGICAAGHLSDVVKIIEKLHGEFD